MRYFALFCFLLFLFVGCEYSNVKRLKNGDRIKVNGRVRLVGNAPFETLSVHTKDREYLLLFLSKEQKQSVFRFQGKIIEVSGTLNIITNITPDLHYTNIFYGIHVLKVSY